MTDRPAIKIEDGRKRTFAKGIVARIEETAFEGCKEDVPGFTLILHVRKGDRTVFVPIHSGDPAQALCALDRVPDWYMKRLDPDSYDDEPVEDEAGDEE